MRLLLQDIKETKKDPFDILFSSRAGKFFLDHIGVSFEEFKQNTNISVKIFSGFSPKTFSELITEFEKKLKACGP